MTEESFKAEEKDVVLSAPHNESRNRISISVPFTISLSEGDQIMDRVRQHIGAVEAFIASIRGSRRPSVQESRSVKTMLRKMKSRYTDRSGSTISTMYKRESKHVKSTLQLIDALKGLSVCLLVAYEEDGTVQPKDVVEEVALIPHLMKTIMLMENDGIRTEILALPILRRVMLCKYSVLQDNRTNTHGMTTERLNDTATTATSHRQWLLNLFRESDTKERAVDYLEIISNLTIFDYLSLPVRGQEFRVFSPTPTTEDIEAFHQDRMELFHAVAGNQRLTPKLFTLSRKEMERAAVTPAVQWALNEEIRRPFMITIVFCDFVLHAVLLIAFRQVVFYMHDNNGETPSEIVTSIVFFCMCYFLFRIVADLALIRVSWNVFWRNMFYRRTIIETCSTIMVWISMVALYSPSFAIDFDTTGRAYFVFQAFTIFLLWLKALGFLQVMNRTLAAYIYAMFEILYNMGWFIVIMVVMVFGFGDVFYIVYTIYRRPEENDNAVCGTETESPFCDSKRGISYLTIYRVFVGDIQVEEYTADSFTTFLFVVVTFFGVIVLLNMLIALVTTSYEGSQSRSDRLFGRARVALVAKGLALERLMFPGSSEDPLRTQCFSIVMRLLAICMVCFLAYLAATPVYFLLDAILSPIIGETTALYVSVVAAIIASVYMCVVLIMYIWVGWDTERSETWCGRFLRRRWVFNVCIVGAVKFIALTLLGFRPWHKKTLQEISKEYESSSSGGYQSSTYPKNANSTMDSYAEMEVWFGQIEQDWRADVNTMELKIAERDAKYRSNLEAMEQRAVERDSKREAALADREIKHEFELKEMEKRILQALQGSAAAH